jgi:16S rRNA (cytidine1402-2'-O)-methyltransferase
MQGTLYVVSLPIGNLADVTLRAIETLKGVSRILAEDTRRTRILLDHYEIRTPLTTSYYQGVEEERVAPIVSWLQAGEDLALVSDAGTPLVSDPGFPLVRAAVESGIRVVPIPGPTAFVTALVACGLPVDRFVFDGSLPRKAGDRRAYLESIRDETRTVTVYESPHRLLSSLRMIAEVLPERRIALARELTKVHEEVLRGTASSVLETLSAREGVRGECVLVLEGNRDKEKGAPVEVDALLTVLREEGIAGKTALRILTAVGLPRNEAYRRLHAG